MIIALYIYHKEEKVFFLQLKFTMVKFRYSKQDITLWKVLIMPNNFEICYTSDCCGAYVHSDAQICPTCYEHCEVIEDCTVYEDSDAAHFDSMLDFHGAG